MDIDYLGRCERHGGLVWETDLVSVIIDNQEQLWCDICIVAASPEDLKYTFRQGVYEYKG